MSDTPKNFPAEALQYKPHLQFCEKLPFKSRAETLCIVQASILKCLKSQTWFSCQSGNGNWPSHGQIRLVGVTKQAGANKDGCWCWQLFNRII